MLRYRRKNTIKIGFTVYRQKRYRQKRENRLPPKSYRHVTLPSKSVKNIVAEHLPENYSAPPRPPVLCMSDKKSILPY